MVDPIMRGLNERMASRYNGSALLILKARHSTNDIIENYVPVSFVVFIFDSVSPCSEAFAGYVRFFAH